MIQALGCCAGAPAPLSASPGAPADAGAAPGDTYAQGVALFQQQQYAQSVPLFQKAVQENPNDSKAYYYLGVAQVQVGGT